MMGDKYAGKSREELMQEAQTRGISVSDPTSDEQIREQLERHDQQQSGSTQSQPQGAAR
jgi:hypothetical protein